MTSLGTSLTREDGPAKVAGRSLYAADIAHPDALWGGFVRSAYPHARIVSIDASQAEAVDGVVAIITADDLPDKLVSTSSVNDKPVLARGVVRYVGEAVAAVAATTKGALEAALTLVKVEYEELPAIFEPAEAFAEGAQVLHPNYANYDATTYAAFEKAQLETVGLRYGGGRVGDVFGPTNMPEGIKNTQSMWLINKGDIDRGFAESDQIFEGTYKCPMIFQAYMEPRACLVEIDDQERVHVWASNQAPFRAKRGLAAYAGIPDDSVVLHSVNVGGSFGEKSPFEDISAAYFLAKKSKRAVRIHQKYEEVLQDGGPRHSATIFLRTGVKNDGRLWAWHATVHFNGGAYAARTPSNANLNGTLRVAGAYRTPNVVIESRMAYTNRVPSGYYRAPGEVQTLFAVESHIDSIAHALGIDPLEFRTLNTIRDGDTQPSGAPIDDPRGLEVLEELKKVSQWSSPKGTPDSGTVRRGRGMALGYRHIGGGESSMKVVVAEDGTVHTTTSVVDTGTGTHTMHRQVIAEVLGISPDSVQVHLSSTDGPYDQGVRASRGTHIEGQAAIGAAGSLVSLLSREAANHWGITVEQVDWADGKATDKESGRQLTLQDIARMSRDTSLETEASYRADTSNIHDFQSMVAEVVVDIETGQVTVERVTFVHDGTIIINPHLHDGQIKGGVIQGLGDTLMEELAIDKGRITTIHLADYRIPSIQDIPPLSIHHVKANVGPGPFDAKGVSELGLSPIGPAVGNAIYDAVGVRVTSLPLTAEKVSEGLRSLATKG